MEHKTVVREETPNGVRYRMGIEWDSLWASVRKVGIVALQLKGHENHLFEKHLSFKSA